MFLRRLVTKKEEQGQYSGGFWPAKIREMALRLVPKQGKLLEVGCGEGLFLDALRRESSSMELYGIDYWDKILGLAKERLKGTSVKLSQADGTKLPFENALFDCVVCVNVLLNLPGLDTAVKVLQEMKRVVKDDGLLVFEIRNKRSPLFKVQYRLAKYLDPDLKAPLNTYDIADIAGLVNIKKVHYIGFPKNSCAPVIICEARKE
jgi:ubiquinone/menaquinone biosynthesis C-methylase UbiE